MYLGMRVQVGKRLCDKAENTHLLRKGKYHCMADHLFDWFGFSCFVELKL